jgi:4-alpha-glucanotransferase
MGSSVIAFSPSTTYEEALGRAADLWGVEREYWDIWGRKHVAAPEAIRAVLESMGVSAGSRDELDRAVEQRLWNEWKRIIPPALVISVNDPVISLRLAAGAPQAAVRITVRNENGGSESITRSAEALEQTATAYLRGSEFQERRLRLPFELPVGYHELEAGVEGQAETTRSARLIVCPDRAWLPASLAGNGRAAGIAVSLYGLRSRRNWGCGDFTDLRAFIDWTAEELGASFVGLNPLHAIPNRQPYNISPYLPLCTFYKNLIYLDIEAIEDFAASRWAQALAACPRIQAEIAALREAEYVEYERVSALKLRFLRMLFRTFLRREFQRQSQRAREFQQYCEREGRFLDDFARFRALEDVLRRRLPGVWLWRDWPPEYHDPHSDATEDFARRHWRSVLFQKYIQWQIDRQLDAAQRFAQERGLAIGLYHDLALATDRFGADLWAHRRFYVEGSRVGAPPDDFSPNGQDWSFPPPNSLAHFEDGYRLFAESIRKNLRHGGALRIDHVMRFFHLFWIPEHLDATRGIYVRDRHEDLIRILALESVRNRVIIVGEDLGTVADQVRETLARFGILSYRLFYFEKWGDGAFKSPRDYPEQALVSASTHDLPTLDGFWRNRDIEARRRAGLIPDEGSYQAQIRARAAEKQKMLDLLFREGLLPDYVPKSADQIPELTGELHNAIVGFLALTPSRMMVLGEEDLMKQPDQQNLPGTTGEYPNWRHKTRFTIEELWTSQLAKDFAAMYRGWLERTGRLNRA